MAVEVDSPCLKFVQTISIWHLDSEAFLESYIFHFRNKELTKIDFVDLGLVVKLI